MCNVYITTRFFFASYIVPAPKKLHIYAHKDTGFNQATGTPRFVCVCVCRYDLDYIIAERCDTGWLMQQMIDVIKGRERVVSTSNIIGRIHIQQQPAAGAGGPR